MTSKLERIDSSQFTKRRWEQGSVHSIIGDTPCRYWNLTLPKTASLLRKYVVGWCPADQLAWKPKVGEVAVMAFKDERHFWFHLRINEFEKIWRKIK